MMKFILLIGFLSATALGAPHRGVCPALPPDTMGTCVEACSTDADCDLDHKCCSNGCGHTCQLAQPPLPDKPPRGHRAGCATVRCAPCYKCVGNGKCVPAGGPGCAKNCDRHNPCGRDYQCTDTPNGPQCMECPVYRLVPPPEGCRYEKTYPQGDTGCAKWELKCDEGCAAMLCEECSDCVEVDGQGKCVFQGNCCPDDEQHQCFADPCKATPCPAAAHCKSDYCGGCKAIFYDDKWNEISGDQCGISRVKRHRTRDPCHHHRCHKCDECVEVHGWPKCVRGDGSCCRSLFHCGTVL